MAVPQVVMHRLSQMMLAGPNPSAKDLREMNTMWTEKLLTFHESWFAMAFEAARVNQHVSLKMMESAWSFTPFKDVTLSNPTKTFLDATDSIIGKGLAPVHRCAVDNAKRLGK